MNFMDSLEKNIYSVLTEKGDKAYATSGSYCLDYFALIGGFRHQHKHVINSFLKAFFEDKYTALKLLFYTRDIREGLGERNSFRLILNVLANFYPDIARQIIPYVPEYGRFDDLLVCLDTPIHNDIIEFIRVRLEEDIKLHQEGKEISLLAKWLPSVNTSNKDTVKFAKKIAKGLNMTEEEYRKTLSMLRKGRIIENYLRTKDYTFDYQKQPSNALLKYQKAFIRNDYERYFSYLVDVNAGKAKMNTQTLYPYQIVSKIMYQRGKSKLERSALDTTWKNLPRISTNRKAIVVRDGSGSMYINRINSPIAIATSLALFFSEQLTPPFKNAFITFSENPQLVKVPEKLDIYGKVIYTLQFDEVANTNISKVYELILNVARSNDVKPEDMIEQIIIISDMEFDQCVVDKTSYEIFREEFLKLGYKLPQVVFWNVEARNVHVPVTRRDQNVIMVSGSSDKIFDFVVNNDLNNVNPYDFMLDALKKYGFVDNLKL